MSNSNQFSVLAGDPSGAGAFVNLHPRLTAVTLVGPNGSFVLMTTGSDAGPTMEAWVAASDQPPAQVALCQLSQDVVSVKLFGRWGLWLRDEGERLRWQLERFDGEKRTIVRSGCVGVDETLEPQ